MANKIQLRRGLKANLPLLSPGEPAFCTDTGELYIGTASGNVLASGAGNLSPATSAVLGGIKLGSDTVQTVAANTVSSTASRSYAIQKNSSGQAVVNVPWTDNNTTYSALSQSEANAGTATTARTISAKVLTDTIKSRGVLSGSYVGDGVQTREINLGFAPQAVYVSSMHHLNLFEDVPEGALYANSGFATAEYPYKWMVTDSNGIINITENGFTVLNRDVAPYGPTFSAKLNHPGTPYNYFVIR